MFQGRIDVVVNNAGYGLSGAFETLAEDQIRTQMVGHTRDSD
jgi:short-subunit dehydrogenase